jgi:putative oxidoreductase
MLRPARIALDRVTAPYATLLLRLALGIVFIAHGLFKVLVLTLSETAAFFITHGFPEWTVYPVFAAEVVGGAALVVGFYTRVVALALLPVLLGAFAVHWTNGWYFGNPHGGWEYIAVLLAALLVQAGLGDGAFALVPWKRDGLHKSRSAAPGSQGVTTEHTGVCEGGATRRAGMPRPGIM